MSSAVASMLTYHNNPARKVAMVESMQEHRRLDRVQQCETGERAGRGCAVSCAFQSVTKNWKNSYSHLGLADHLGVEQWVPVLVDRIFEGLPSAEAGEFAEKWLAAMPVGADATPLKAKVLSWLVQAARGYMKKAREAWVANGPAIRQRFEERLAKARQRMDAATAAVMDLLEAQISGARPVTAAERRAVRDEAWAARNAFRNEVAEAAAEAAAAAAAAAEAEAEAEAAAAEAAAAEAEVAEAAAEVAEAAAAAAEAEGSAAWWNARSSGRHQHYRDFAAFFVQALSELPVQAPAA